MYKTCEPVLDMSTMPVAGVPPTMGLVTGDGGPQLAAGAGFDREPRRRALSRIAARLRSEPDDVSAMLPFEEVVAALGRRGQTDLGVQKIRLDTVVGTVDRRPDTFDRAFRPRTNDVRGRWERVAAARRQGIELPPIDVYRIGELHFVQDGHHRVSVARALGEETILARVRLVITELGAGRDLELRDLPLKRHERVFHERVPLPRAKRRRIELSDEWRYAQLATLVESWAFRASHHREDLLSREHAAEAWFDEEYEPVTRVLHEVGAGGSGTETERYLRVATLRFLLLQTHDWTDDVVERLLGEMRAPSSADDTMVHQILKEMD